jgi:hypothetical protein
LVGAVDANIYRPFNSCVIVTRFRSNGQYSIRIQDDDAEIFFAG